MLGSLRRSATTGHLLKSNTSTGGAGRLSKCQDCDECSRCTPCGSNHPSCPSGAAADCCTPSRWRLTFSGIAACSSDCIECGSGSINNIVLPTLNGTYVATQESGCVWVVTVGDYSFDYYPSSTTCSGTPESRTGSLLASLARGGMGASDTEYKLSLRHSNTQYDEGLTVYAYGVATSLMAADADRCDQDVSHSSPDAGCSGDDSSGSSILGITDCTSASVTVVVC